MKKLALSYWKKAVVRKAVIVFATGFIATSVSYYGLRYRAVTLAENFISEGFGALAADTVEPFRHSLTSWNRGCKTLINAYFSARQTERLEWASQACITKKPELAEGYLGFASAREFSGRDNDALQILAQASQKFLQVADIPYRIGHLLKRNQKGNEAAPHFFRASQLAPQNNQLAMEALENLVAVQAWELAKSLALRLKDVPTQSPEVKLIIARALTRAGDTEMAQGVVEQARALLNQHPELKPTLETNFRDVLQPKALKAGFLAKDAKAMPSNRAPAQSK